MNDPNPIPRVTREVHKVRSRRAHEAPDKEAATAAPEATVGPAEGRSGSRLLNVGYGNLVAARRVVAIVAPTASPMRRLRHEAAERGKLVDATEGRRTRSIVILDSDHVVLSAIHPETLAARLAEGEAGPHA